MSYFHDLQKTSQTNVQTLTYATGQTRSMHNQHYELFFEQIRSDIYSLYHYNVLKCHQNICECFKMSLRRTFRVINHRQYSDDVILFFTFQCESDPTNVIQDIENATFIQV